MVLMHAAELCEYIGRSSTADEYRARAAALTSAVNLRCFDKKLGLYFDGPGAIAERSQHVQVFAVLVGAIDGEDAKELMRKTVKHWKELRLAKASFAMSFYMFRAVAKAGIYEEVWEMLIEPWKKMIGENLTTWAESASMVRSDCHGWSATPMYEIVREIIGIKAAAGKQGYGFEKLSIEPRLSLLAEAEGTFVIGNGEEVNIFWNECKHLSIKCTADKEVEVVQKGITRTYNMKAGETISLESDQF